MAKLCRQFCRFDRAKIDVEKRTVELAFSSEYAVDRGDYDEILDHTDPKSCDLSRMSDGAPLLLCHDAWDGQQQIGVVESARIDADKIGRAVARFGKGELAEQIWQDVQDGIRRHVSVGYARTGVISSEKTDNREKIRYRWLPFELSIVPVPADPTVGVGRIEPLARNFSTPETPMKRSILLDVLPSDGNGNTTAKIDVVAERNKAVTDERARTTAIRAAASSLIETFKDSPEAAAKFRELADKACAEGMSLENANAEFFKALPGVRKAQTDQANLGLSDKEKKRYSMLNGIRRLLENKPVDGFERECSDELAKRSGMNPDGFWMPTDLTVDAGAANRVRAMMNRDLNVTTAAQGGNFVQTTIVTPIVEILRNRMVLKRLGMQALGGLVGGIAIPRQTGAATAYSVSEQAAITKSTQAIDQIPLSPKRVGAWNNYTKQLLLQSTPDVENFVRDDLMAVTAIKHDKLGLEGSGAGNEPTGILSTSGIGAVTFGAAPTWAKILAFESAIADANADIGVMAYVTSPLVRAALKAAVKAGTFPVFIWDGNMGDGTNDGLVNSYRAAVTKQISGNKVAFGVWSELVQAMWGGFDITVDPFSVAEQGVVRIVVNTFIDYAVRHPAAFAWSTDAGNQ